MARCVWALEEEEITEQLGIIQIPNAKAWPTEIFKTFAGAPLVRVVVVLGAIWHARRKAIHEEIYQSPCNQMLCRSIPGRARMCSTTTKRQRKSQGGGGGGRMPPQWIPPPVGMMKINVDASVSKNKKISSAVVVARNTAGVFLGASAIVLEGVTDLETMEVMACREGLALATDLGLQDI